MSFKTGQQVITKDKKIQGTIVQVGTWGAGGVWLENYIVILVNGNPDRFEEVYETELEIVE